MQSYYGFTTGDKVTVKKANKSYDNAPDAQPNMTGTIKTFPPKISIPPISEVNDKKLLFAYVIFDQKHIDHGNHAHQIRGGIDICNLKHKT